MLERSEGGRIKGRHAAEEREDAGAAPDAQAGEDVGEAARHVAEIGVAERFDTAVEPYESERDVLGPGPGGVAVDGLVRHVKALPAGKTGKPLPGLIPPEGRPRRLVVDEYR